MLLVQFCRVIIIEECGELALCTSLPHVHIPALVYQQLYLNYVGL